MKRSIVEVSMPQHYRDSSLSSLESLFSNFTENDVRQVADNAINDYHLQQPYHHHHHVDHSYHDYQTTIDYPPPPQQLYCSSFEETAATTFSTMQEEYNSSTKQPTPGRPKMARILASSSPEISALCRKSATNSSSTLQLPPFEYDNDTEQQTTSFSFSSYNFNNDGNAPYDFPAGDHNYHNNSYNLSSDSSNFSMSSSSMESLSYPPVNRTSSASISTWEDPPPPRMANRKTLTTKRYSGSCTIPTVSSTAATAASITTTTTSGTVPRPTYVSVGSPHIDDTSRLNYSGSDLELEAITSSLNTIQLYQPEPRVRLNSASSFASAPTRTSTIGTTGTSGGLQRPSLHRRISYDSLPTPEMIMYETVPLNSSLPPPPTLLPPPPPPSTPPPSIIQRSSSDRIVLPPSASPLLANPRSSNSSVGSRHRRNTTQIVMPPMKPVVP